MGVEADREVERLQILLVLKLTRGVRDQATLGSDDRDVRDQQFIAEAEDFSTTCWHVVEVRCGIVGGSHSWQQIGEHLRKGSQDLAVVVVVQERGAVVVDAPWSVEEC